MEPIAIDEVVARLDENDEPFEEFLRRESMSLEVYRLPAGASDPQDPHDEDEAYYVVAGAATIRIGEETHAIGAGDVIFVARGVEHYFFDIEEELITLIFFAPPFSG